jgi:glycosyltransferase involved in cell wall biosynthesis
MITEFLKQKFEIHVLEIHHEADKTIFENGIWLHKIEYSDFGKLLNPDVNITADFPNLKGKLVSGLKSRFKKLIRKLFFPDTVIFEKNRLIRKVKEFLRSNDIHTVIASGFPFTTMILSATVKKDFPSVRFIYDVGDPFYKNSQNGLIRDWLAKLFERKYLKYIDKLVVTNNATFQHYSDHFGDVINPCQVAIIQMGVPRELLELVNEKFSQKRDSFNNNELRLVYAGQLYTKLREPYELYKAIAKWNCTKDQRKITLDMYGSFSDVFKTGVNDDLSIFFKSKASNKEIIEAYYNNDVIIFLDNAWGLQTPGKVFEVAAVGRPVLFISDHENSPAKEVVKDLGHFYYCKNKCDLIIETIRKIKKNPDIGSIDEIRKRFSWQTRADQYASLIND